MLDSFENVAACPSFSGDLQAALRNLVEGQLRPSGVRDPRLLQAMGTLPRACFVPAHLASTAFRDGAFRVAAGRYLLDPTLLARLIEATEIRSDEVVLDLAPATGYSSAVLASLACRVVALEGDPVLAARLQENILKLQMQNVQLLAANEAEGWEILKPCRVVLINGAVEVMPQALLDTVQDGTRIAVLVVCSSKSEKRGKGEKKAFPLSEARLYTKEGGHVSFRILFEAEAPRLEMFDAPTHFSF